LRPACRPHARGIRETAGDTDGRIRPRRDGGHRPPAGRRPLRGRQPPARLPVSCPDGSVLPGLWNDTRLARAAAWRADARVADECPDHARASLPAGDVVAFATT